MARVFTVLAAACASVAVAAPVASAATIGYDGGTLVLRAAPGERNVVVVDSTDGQITFTDDPPLSYPADHCSRLDVDYPVACDMPAAGVLIDLGDGNDQASFGFEIPTALRFEIDGGPGNDILKGPRNGIGSATLDGGDGDDQLTSEEAADTLLGGPGNDALVGGAGADVLRGGDGNDKLRGDDPSGAYPDLLDGGAGSDELTDYDAADAAASPAVDITLDGVANDGRPGEGDNIVGVEELDVGAVRTFTGDDGPNVFTAPEKGTAARILGMGGNDVLTASDANGDVVDGGSGDDTLNGGMGDDTIVGGPGSDTIAGDRPARCNELHCDFTSGWGDDTIDVRDGAVDHVQCGPGTDTVTADPIDLVADDCEHVTGATAGGSGAGAGAGASVAGTAGATAARITGTTKLASVLRGGLRVAVAVPAAGRVGASARSAQSTVAMGSGTARRAGTITIRARFSASARRRLAHRRSVALKIAVRFAPSGVGQATTRTIRVTLRGSH